MSEPSYSATEQKTCCECGQSITVYHGHIKDAPSNIDGYPKSVPSIGGETHFYRWICEGCAEAHYEAGHAAWASDGVLVMMPSYYE